MAQETAVRQLLTLSVNFMSSLRKGVCGLVKGGGKYGKRTVSPTILYGCLQKYWFSSRRRVPALASIIVAKKSLQSSSA